MSIDFARVTNCWLNSYRRRQTRSSSSGWSAYSGKPHDSIGWFWCNRVLSKYFPLQFPFTQLWYVHIQFPAKKERNTLANPGHTISQGLSQLHSRVRHPREQATGSPGFFPCPRIISRAEGKAPQISVSSLPAFIPKFWRRQINFSVKVHPLRSLIQIVIF